MSNIITAWVSKLSQTKYLSDRADRLHVCRTCKEESGKISPRWLLFLLVVIAGGLLFSGQIIKGLKGFSRSAFPDKQVNYIIAVDNSSRSGKYLDQARGQIDKIMQEIPDGNSSVTLITLSAPQTPVKGKADIKAFLQGMKPASIPTDFKLLFGAIREQVAKDRRNRVFLISNGKYDPVGSIYLEGLDPQDSQAQSLVLAEEIRDSVRLPENCELKALSIGNNPDEIILQAIVSMNTK